jgi:hypothetical protein
VSQLRYAAFELVVVADGPGRAALRGLPQAAPAKIVPCDQPGIAAARNLGIAAAAGEIVAFLDDDAVPEPSWLRYLAAPFADPEVAAAGGYVLGRNGISWQWQGRTVDRQGQTDALDIVDTAPRLLQARPGLAIKTEGTNMAVRRSVLQELGGFNPAYSFYLDETDLNMRLAARHAVTAVLPLAQVHHGFLASERRRPDRVPLDLTEIGASWSVFLQSHCPADQRGMAWQKLAAAERRRLLGFMVRGLLEPRDVRRLMRQLQAGHAAGPSRPPSPASAAPEWPAPFQPYPVSRAGSVLIGGRIWSRPGLRRKARQMVETGRIVTLICLSPTPQFHRVRYTTDGVWEQNGGLFGKSVRSQRLFSMHSLRGRLQDEADRVRLLRLLDYA